MNEHGQRGIKVKSLAKALGLFDYFTQSHPERGITELAEMSGLLKSSTSNMVATLEACGFIERNPVSGKYRLGLKLLRLSNQLYVSHDLRNLLRPHMERLSSSTGENVYLATLNEGEVVYIDAVFPVGSYFARSIIGVSAPLYCTGVGKAIMAYLDDELINSVTARGFESFTPNTIRDAAVLKQELLATRERGYSIDNMEHEYGIKCVAVPLRDIRGVLVASMSISGPSPRFTDERMAQYVQMLFETQKMVKELM